MSDPFALPWLLPPPADFRARLKAIRTADGVDAAGLRALVQFALDATQLEQAGRVVSARAADLADAGLRPLKLGIVASHTAKTIAYALPAAALRHGLLLSVDLADYGQAAQALLDPRSSLVQAAPDVILLALDAQALGLARPCLDASEAEATVTRALDYVAALRAGGRDHAGAPVIVQTLVPPVESLFGSFDGQLAGTVRWLVAEFNARLLRDVTGSGDLVLDVAFLASTVGLAQWHDARLWHDAKLPFAVEALPLYADKLGGLLAAFRGLSRKCLVLDLDNTLWGGIIGDDGVDGILLGQGSGTGEAHLAVQAFALDLRARGIVLAVCSKNEDAAARLPFTGHSEMLLREEHIAVFLANWTDKATNLRTIAATLNIGTDALVFLDDNPAERAQVRQELPEVAVPEVGANPADFVRILGQAGYFEAISFGDEDRGRAAMYSANAERAAALTNISNLADYHASLEMVCTIAPFDDAGRARIAQLANKSNQFNLTTRRYTEADIAAIAADPTRFTMQVRLADRFGDNGMISVLIFARGAEEWRCETWLMSCRVLGRRVEEAVLAHVATAARAAGAARLAGEYIPTAKNAMVRDHFAKLGFAKTAERADGRTEWTLDLATYVAPALPMKLE
ncbi:HAD-IIIC family phosphatase [Sphingomonas sp. H39-1-10]|uniref:HAD-IIIC family phosphatase n=1 Tax=Sphingomonas pollutisoli TaxID=3030829 RepID=UPI0023B8D63F|nr:HAD-IIIC family phosphatase [Sphingomonas pollutisoli]MDF0490911.1 HAD-IIIC family phosphatase [Sphingomonas pollutisoli]